ncbi:hypothetical protein [Cohnella sp. AR92]|uniref:hypothetical protein n=1 Tax=Cohnella sp. AR92 TaxID=648716 RepID=UPI000F8E0D1A|nr:hypothetical protein [Cohnella sp. AR92]RUS46400.1 hypothetical protein ELR57_15115 [Cohnella sp. AR92]
MAQVPEDGFSYRDLKVARDGTIFLIGENDERRTKLLRYDLRSFRFADWQTVEGEIPLYNLQIASPQEEDEPLAMTAWGFSSEEPNFRSYVLTEEHIAEYRGIRVPSPDGSRAAVYADGRGGIWGIEARSGEEVQWTKGENDAQPLWLSDGSGFIFLKDTGEELGDGAGPNYSLAKYDIQKARTELLPFQQGFWGTVEWLEPGRTLLAHNGFDDAIGLKLVDLSSHAEKQLIQNPTDHRVQTASHNGRKRIMVAQRGSFDLYSDMGDRLSRVPWPADADEFTAINPEYDAAAPENGVPYYKAGLASPFGISDLTFKPDGSGVSFLLGTIGESIDEVVAGTRLFAAGPGGEEAYALTKDYLKIRHHAWTPAGDAVICLIASPERDGCFYLGVKWLDISLKW